MVLLRLGYPVPFSIWALAGAYTSPEGGCLFFRGVVWNWVVVPYMASLPDPLIYQPSSALCFVNISSFKQLL